MSNTVNARAGWAVGGGTLLGLGAGIALLQTSVLWFVGALLGGIGFGLLIGALLPSGKPGR